MAMDFFEQQASARKKTKKLVAIFLAGVVAIILSVHGAVSLAVWQGTSRLTTVGGAPRSWIEAYLLNPELFAWVALGVLAVVSTGSVYKLKALGGGGEKVAAHLGGTRVDPGTADPEERKLLNVVEEMAIASGVPVPPVFIMEGEEGINAFAAGFETGDAVIGVTRGAVHHLNRDELQGVIAHEFSHILNGDMRLNLRLIGILHGVLLIGIMGRLLLYSGGRRSRGKGNQAAILGLALLAIGYLGTLCGNLIKAAVSREREFLADAAAVQFTRNPDGIAGALKKLGGLARGSKIEHPRASELSHMYFGRGIVNHLGSLFATHPPLEERVKRIDPSFDGRFPAVGEAGAREAGAREAGAREEAERDRAGRSEGEEGAEDEWEIGAVGLAAAAGMAGGSRSTEGPAATPSPDASDTSDAPDAPDASGTVSLEDALAQVGRPTPQHVAYVRALLSKVPEPLRAAAHEREGAEALLYALMMDADAGVREQQLQALDELAAASLRDRTRDLFRHLERLDPNARLPLMEVLIATLRGLDDEEFRRLREGVRTLTEADDRIDLFEWVAGSLVMRHLDPRAGEEKRRGSFTRVEGLSDSVTCVLSALAHAGHEERDEARMAFRTGIDSLLSRNGEDGPLPPEACGPRVLDGALDRLSRLVPGQKKRLLEACARTIAADRRVTTREGELFRVVADWMDCPVPPLLPGQRVTTAEA